MRRRVSVVWPAGLALLLPLAHSAAETGFLSGGEGGRLRAARMHGDLGSAAGAFLCGQVAMDERNYTVAAIQFQVAMQADPRSLAIGRQALAANLLAGRPLAVPIARQVVRTEPGNPTAQLVLAGSQAMVGHWQAAAQHFAAMSGEGVFGLMQQPLLAWAQFGAGRKDAMRALLGPMGRGDAVGGAYLFQAGLMADLADRPADAERFYVAAAADLGVTDIGLARALASLQARQGRQAEARKTIAAAGGAGLHLDASAPRLQAAIAQRPVRDAGDAIAAIYASFAVLARQHAAAELSDMLYRLALDLRPDFTLARLQWAVALNAEHRTQAALSMLSEIDAGDVLEPSAEVLRGKFLSAVR